MDFMNGDMDYDSDDDDPTEQDTPRTLVELRMCALSAAIREKAGLQDVGDEPREQCTAVVARA